MKKILTLILFLIYSSILFSQEKDSLLVGEWKVICIETHNYYYNSVTDSLSYSKEYKRMLPDLIKSKPSEFKNLEDFNQYTKNESRNHKFIFQDNDIYLRKKEDKTYREGNYNVHTSKKTISFKDKNEPEYIMEYYVEKGLLYLTMNYKRGIKIQSKTIYLKPMKFILQKTTTS